MACNSERSYDWYGSLKAKTLFMRETTDDTENDFVTFLLCLSSALRVGQDPLHAVLSQIPQFSNRSLGIALKKLEEKIQEGLPEQDAIKDFGAMLPCSESNLFVTAYLLARKQGAPLSQFLRRLATVVRQRQALRRKKRSALAMQRLSAIAMGMCASLIVLMQLIFQYDTMKNAWHDEIGMLLLIGAGLLIVLGMGWMFFFTRDAA